MIMVDSNFPQKPQKKLKYLNKHDLSLVFEWQADHTQP